MPGRIVLLNGPSSVGKTTVAAALQDASPGHWLRLGLDNFLDFVPEPLTNVNPSADDGFRWFPGDPGAGKATQIVVGEYGHLVIRGMHRAIAAMAMAGLDLIVDDVLLYPAWLDDYLVALDGCDVVFVGITAPLEVIEQREAERGDRFVGQARGHYETVHRHGQYDILLNTQESTINEGVATILDRLDAGPGEAFGQLRRSRLSAA